ncbi:MAG: NUDIX hydrolase [Sandaracinaceae bacterium]|nr:NUDIX hydrolase [Sandaracinaceae bacterium]
MRPLPLTAALLLLSGCGGAQAHDEHARAVSALTPTWTESESDAVLSRTMRIHVAPDLSQLTEGERAAVGELLAAGALLDRAYLRQRHPEGAAALDFLVAHPELSRERDLFRAMEGPIATTLENDRVAFLSVGQETPGRAMYPEGTTRESLEAFLEAHPERRADLLDDRTVVWAATPERRAEALAALSREPVIEALHPGLRERLSHDETFLALPYSLAFAEELVPVTRHLYAAASAVEEGDPSFARYLRLRARDLLADDYEGGDAAWVTSDFTGHLNAQIGAYETYDDPLFGVKSFFALSLLVRDRAQSAELASAVSAMQGVEDALPYESHRRVRTDTHVGVYEIIADFGQARGTNTATILPNEAYLSRQYGRTILLRATILLSPELFAESARSFDAAVAPAHHGELRIEGNFHRTLWHEVGHYLGVDRTADGRDLDVALSDTADLLEEMKADLVSLFAARWMRSAGLVDDARLAAIEAAGIRRVLLKNQPRREQPYQTMQLIQWNWFLDHGLLAFDGGALVIDRSRYGEAVESLLREVLALQRAGDRDRAETFVTRWTTWQPELHGVIAQRMRESERSRFALVTYEALGEAP